MSEAQLKEIGSKAWQVEVAKGRLAEAEKAVAKSIADQRAAEAELHLRGMEYKSACEAAVGLVHDPCRGPNPNYIR